MLQIKDLKKLPREGFLFFEAGRTFNEMYSWGHKVDIILQFRQDNNLPRATRDEVSEDLSNFTCNRLPGVCFDPGSMGISLAPKRGVGGCAGCGGHRV